MTNERPLILITNDDGVWAKGINELIECLKDLGDLVVFAPDGPRSGMGSAITSLVPIKYTLLKKEEGLTIYSCTGTPVDCVKLAINEVLERKPDLLVSGINHGGEYGYLRKLFRNDGCRRRGMYFQRPFHGCILTGPCGRCRLLRMLPSWTYAGTPGIKRRLTARNLLKPQRAEATASERVESLSPSGWPLGT